MSTPIDDGGPLHPIISTPGVNIVEHKGISLRDWFATKATDKDLDSIDPFNYSKQRQMTRQELRFAWADAMLAAREKKP